MSEVDRFWNGDISLSPETEMVLAKDYDQLKADYAEIESALVTKNHEAHDLEIENRQLKAENERIKLRLWDLEHSEVDHVLRERDQLKAENERLQHFAEDESYIRLAVEKERDTLRKQLDEARDFLTDAVEWNWLDEDAPSRESVDAWLAANPA